MGQSNKSISDHTRVKRNPKRGQYDPEVIKEILDQSTYCHVAFVQDGLPFCIPTGHARVGDFVYIHGSTASRMIHHLTGKPVCLTVTILDGLVMARSVFHHSMNYRSVVIFGEGELIETESDKEAALEAFTEKIAKGRWDDARRPSGQELKGTAVVRIPISEASAKIRSGGPVDDAPDYELPVWAGVIPIKTTLDAPVPDEKLSVGIPFPDYLKKLY